MAKKYELTEEETTMASEPVAAYAYDTVEESLQVDDWSSDDAPCRYSVNELQNIIREGEEDIAKGKFHTHADVQQNVLNKILAWR